MQIIDNFEPFAVVLEECMNQAIAARSFKDHLYTALKEVLGSQVIASIADVLFECVDVIFTVYCLSF